ncbi:sensor histidine kinase [Owenweeksia hongkongensis]|uniref:sensor histidine kinase n=1 Tax=Owenweeksia hongkongensis TaxID=253245 RepID=UPI003A95487A
MASKRFALLISLRILLIAANVLLSAWLLFDHHLLFTQILLALLLIAQIAELIYFASKVNRELKRFFDALNYNDFSVSFNNKSLGGSFRELDESFVNIIEKVKTSKAQRESQSELLKLALDHLRLGIIIVDHHGGIMLINQAAQSMLSIPHFHSWEMLQKKKPAFSQALGDFKFEGRKLIELDSGQGIREYYLDLDHISLMGTNYRLISFNDLKNEIEQKEIDAWHKLIRILAHEVMNSVTPVTSLSETIKDLLTDESGKPLTRDQISTETIDDIILALNTIIRRSRGMLNFVDEYRKLTKLPAPNFEVFSVEELFDTVIHLMQGQANKKKVSLKKDLLNNRLALRADKKMVEQVLINLIGNALYAMEVGKGDEIILSAKMESTAIVITVKDNGPGIKEDILHSIFIPFFSTRKNGSGIGLTLSKNIMQLHKGRIHVQSKENEGAVFELSFSI